MLQVSGFNPVITAGVDETVVGGSETPSLPVRRTTNCEVPPEKLTVIVPSFDPVPVSGVATTEAMSKVHGSASTVKLGLTGGQFKASPPNISHVVLPGRLLNTAGFGLPVIGPKD